MRFTTRRPATARFLDSLPLIERAAADDRNFVKKGVSWALRAVGRRNPELNAAAVTLARRLAASRGRRAAVGRQGRAPGVDQRGGDPPARGETSRRQASGREPPARTIRMTARYSPRFRAVSPLVPVSPRLGHRQRRRRGEFPLADRMAVDRDGPATRHAHPRSGVAGVRRRQSSWDASSAWQVRATDLWINASENIQRIRDAGVDDGVFPIHADARALPFAGEFFDAIVCVDAYFYFGTDDLYLNYLARFVKREGPIFAAPAAGVLCWKSKVRSLKHLRAWWSQDLWCLHSAAWWRRHWERTGIADVELADTMADGWLRWLDWQRTIAPDNAVRNPRLSKPTRGALTWATFELSAAWRVDAKLEEYCSPDTMRFVPMEVHKDSRCSRSQEP